MKLSWIISTLLCACTGCQTSLEYDNTKRATAHPELPRAAFHAPAFTQNALKTIAELEWKLELRPD